MINLNDFVSYIEDNYDLLSGVPCSYFKEFLSKIGDIKGVAQIKHIIATREDEAIGIATGAALSQKRALVYMQNSGLGNIGDALTSLAQLYKLPMLILVSSRGLEDDSDFPEHSIMGEINDNLLETLKLKYWDLKQSNWQESMKKARSLMDEQSLPVVLMVKKGVLSP
ncbi:MAG: thiamine pyrophosphate-binding protein [Candidatus Hodarchaeales archaeon]|jgi:phosphonopyruvate decarboxylase